jgi:tRNA A-37 threonylcarbamoyl transferase component Bud32
MELPLLGASIASILMGLSQVGDIPPSDTVYEVEHPFVISELRLLGDASPVLLAGNKSSRPKFNTASGIKTINENKLEVHRATDGKIFYKKFYDKDAVQTVNYTNYLGDYRAYQNNLGAAATKLAEVRLDHEYKMMRVAYRYDAAPKAWKEGNALVMENGGITIETILRVMSEIKPSDEVMQAATKFLHRKGVEALTKLQKSGIVHTDPHLGNVVIDDKLVPRVIDFGQAKFARESEQAQFDKLLYDTVGGDFRFTPRKIVTDNLTGRPVGNESQTNYKTDTYYFTKAFEIDFEQHKKEYGGPIASEVDAMNLLKKIKGANHDEMNTKEDLEALGIITRVINRELARLSE